MMWNVVITGPAQKDFQKLPQKDQARVKAALIAMQSDPFKGDLGERLKGKPAATGGDGSATIVISVYDLDFNKHQIVAAADLAKDLYDL